MLVFEVLSKYDNIATISGYLIIITNRFYKTKNWFIINEYVPHLDLAVNDANYNNIYYDFTKNLKRSKEKCAFNIQRKK